MGTQATVHLQDLIVTSYLEGIPPNCTVLRAKQVGFIVSEQVVRNAYTDISNNTTH